MSEYDNNQMDQNNEEIEIRKQHENERKLPEYSFWAEQMTGKAYSNYNPETNRWEYKISDSRDQVLDQTKKTEKKTFGKAVAFVLKAVCFGVIASISFWGFQALYYMANPEAKMNIIQGSGNAAQDQLNLDLPSKTVPKLDTTDTSPIKTTSRTVISDVVDNTMPSIVSIRSKATRAQQWFGREYNEEVEGSGSGIIVGRNERELLIATNNHVVEGSDSIIVTFIDGSEAEAVIKGTDSLADLAVITVNITNMSEEVLEVIKIAKLGNSDNVKVGEMAVAIGNALGYGQSVTVGYISAKDRKVNVSNGYNRNTMILLQTDAAINPGNSGGALLNVDGEVIGINTVKYSSSTVEGMGYAIPISRANPIITELMNREILAEHEQGFLGITGTDVTEDIAENFKMPIGVHVVEVSSGGAANKAGIISGDIITKVNGVEITSIMQLREKVTSLRIGTEIELTYMRSMNGTYEEKVITVALGPRPN